MSPQMYKSNNKNQTEHVADSAFINERTGKPRWTIRNISGTYREQIGNKSGTYQEQIRNISGTYQEHIGNKSGTYREQIRNKSGTNREQIRNIRNISGTYQEHIWNVSSTWIRTFNKNYSSKQLQKAGLQTCDKRLENVPLFLPEQDQEQQNVWRTFHRSCLSRTRSSGTFYSRSSVQPITAVWGRS